VKMRRCEDEKMFYRPPLLEEPYAQTLSGKTPRRPAAPIATSCIFGDIPYKVGPPSYKILEL